MATHATKDPAEHAHNARTKLSINSCRAICQREAPRAERTAISFSRAVVRASSRFATLLHAINSSASTAASKSYRVLFKSILELKTVAAPEGPIKYSLAATTPAVNFLG